jgi:23S rRNA (pseudouridine1915-N3)-methyltransferase
MKITIASVGRWRAGPERNLYDSYAKRLSWPVTLKEVVAKKTPAVEARMAQEADLLLKAVADCDIVAALDETGKSVPSDAFARQIEDWQLAGNSSIGFIIGGADGLDETVRRRADRVLSFGAMTWPHMLVRVLLIEQIYRAASILAGHPYHRG